MSVLTLAMRDPKLFEVSPYQFWLNWETKELFQYQNMWVSLTKMNWIKMIDEEFIKEEIKKFTEGLAYVDGRKTTSQPGKEP